MVDRTRKMIHDEVEEFDLECVTLGNIAEKITHLMKKYGNEAEIEFGYESFVVSYRRLETDNEMETRIKNEELRERRQMKYELEEYERLKKKFGGE